MAGLSTSWNQDCGLSQGSFSCGPIGRGGGLREIKLDPPIIYNDHKQLWVVSKVSKSKAHLDFQACPGIDLASAGILGLPG